MSDTIHVVFGERAQDVLRLALEAAKRNDEVICCPHDLRCGPINPPEYANRAPWQKAEPGLSPGECEIYWYEANAFWRSLESTAARRIIWFSRRSSLEYAGFLECVSRLAAGSFEAVDLTDARRPRHSPDPGEGSQFFCGLGDMEPSDVHAFLDGARILTAPEDQNYRAIWIRLREEDSGLRIAQGENLISVPVTFFDEALVAAAVNHWRKVARIVLMVLHRSLREPEFEVSPLFLQSRIRALVKAGRLQSEGNLFEMGYSEVRLPGPKPGRG